MGVSDRRSQGPRHLPSRKGSWGRDSFLLSRLGRTWEGCSKGVVLDASMVVLEGFVCFNTSVFGIISLQETEVHPSQFKSTGAYKNTGGSWNPSHVHTACPHWNWRFEGSNFIHGSVWACLVFLSRLFLKCLLHIIPIYQVPWQCS